MSEIEIKKWLDKQGAKTLATGILAKAYAKIKTVSDALPQFATNTDMQNIYENLSQQLQQKEEALIEADKDIEAELGNKLGKNDLVAIPDAEIDAMIEEAVALAEDSQEVQSISE